MKKLLSLILAITLSLTLFASCGKTEQALTSTELLDLGEKYLLDLDYEQAIVYFNQVIEVEPRNARAYMGAAEAYVGLGDTESAINTLKTALDVFSDDEDVTTELLEMLIEIDPTTAEWYLELAQIYIDKGDTDKAIEILERGLANASDTAEIEVLLAELLPEEEPEEEIEETPEENIEEETVEVEPAYESNYGVLNYDAIRNPTNFTESEITEVYFLDSLERAPDDAWDFSLDGDGSVLAWLDGTHLYVAGDGIVNVGEDASFMFFGWKSLTVADFSYLDTSDVRDMHCMFAECSSLISLDLKSFSTSNVVDMNTMFGGCSSLESVDVSSFDTSNVTLMSSMFAGCTSLTYLDLSSFDFSSVTDMYEMFYGCNSLTSLDIDNVDLTGTFYGVVIR